MSGGSGVSGLSTLEFFTLEFFFSKRNQQCNTMFLPLCGTPWKNNLEWYSAWSHLQSLHCRVDSQACFYPRCYLLQENTISVLPAFGKVMAYIVALLLWCNMGWQPPKTAVPCFTVPGCKKQM
jgi:hypothetical protein